MLSRTAPKNKLDDKQNKLELTPEEIAAANTAYRSAVIPMVALIASLFFLGWNIISISIRVVLVCIPSRVAEF